MSPYAPGVDVLTDELLFAVFASYRIVIVVGLWRPTCAGLIYMDMMANTPAEALKL